MPKRDGSPRRKPIANKLASLQLSAGVMQSAAGVLLVLGDKVIDVSVADRGFCEIKTADRSFVIGHNEIFHDGIVWGAANKKDFNFMFQNILKTPPLLPILIILRDTADFTTLRVLSTYSSDEMELLRSWTKLESVHDELYGSGSEDTGAHNLAAKLLLDRVRGLPMQGKIYKVDGSAIILNIRV